MSLRHMTHQELHISLAAAQQLSQAAQKAAADTGIQIVCAVVDANGRCKQLSVMDGAPVIADKMALQKAQTALLGMANDGLAEALQPGSANYDSLLKQQQTNFLAGGLPIVSDDKVIGAIGIGGATTEQDLACAQAALSSLS